MQFNRPLSSRFGSTKGLKFGIIGAVNEEREGDMSAELKTDVQLEIAHVLCSDIVGYSKLLVNEQSEPVQQLNQALTCAKADEVSTSCAVEAPCKKKHTATVRRPLRRMQRSIISIADVLNGTAPEVIRKWRGELPRAW